MNVWVRLLVVGFWACGTTLGWAQTAVTQQQIEAKLQQPFLMLRGMYDGDKLAFDAHGQLIGSAASMPFSLSFLEVSNVAMTEDSVAIEADRAGLNITQGWPSGKPDKVSAVSIDKKHPYHVTITIARDPRHDDWLMSALDRVFHAGFDDSLLAPAPQYWRPWISHELHPERPYPEIPVGVETGPGVLANRKPKPGSIVYPRLVHAEQAPTTEAARTRTVQGSSTIGCIVDEAGIPYDLVVVKPIGMGRNEMAALAVSQYRFTPATKDGQKVRVWLNVIYNFRTR